MLKKQNLENLKNKFDTVILSVAHNEFLRINIREFLKDQQQGVVYDVKGILDKKLVDGRL